MGPEGRDVIITPHPGELARLVGVTTADVQANRIEIAQNFAETHQLYVVLKGHRSIIATPEGKVFVNPTGNAGMATGGMGDLLTGMIAAWLAQLLDAEAACKLAVYLHGMAGDLAEATEGEVALTPSDVLAQLGDAVLELTATQESRGEGARVDSAGLSADSADADAADAATELGRRSSIVILRPSGTCSRCTSTTGGVGRRGSRSAHSIAMIVVPSCKILERDVGDFSGSQDGRDRRAAA